jgi:hypothetical protein
MFLTPASNPQRPMSETIEGEQLDAVEPAIELSLYRRRRLLAPATSKRLDFQFRQRAF